MEGRSDEHCYLTVRAIGAKGKQKVQGGSRDWGGLHVGEAQVAQGQEGVHCLWPQ